jgi:hypothetical protein
MLRATRVPVLRREVRETVPACAIELLVGHAECVVDGPRDVRGSGGLREVTLMWTIDLGACADLLAEPADAATAARLAALLPQAEGLARRLERAAAAQLGVEGRRGSVRLEDLQIRAAGTRVLLDAEVILRGAE